jgi:hypothetical protein
MVGHCSTASTGHGMHAASQGRPYEHIDVIIEIVIVRRILYGAPFLQSDKKMQMRDHVLK